VAVFIGDYRPTKRVGIEELDGCIKLLSDSYELADEQRDKSASLYMGALIAMETIRNGRFEYPKDFMAVFDNRIRELEGE
jgi:hypothetical protein